MTIEQSTLNGTTNLTLNASEFRIINEEEKHIALAAQGWIESFFEYKFRYTVHRQYVGFFTPMVFDVKFQMMHHPDYQHGVQINLEKIVEPFVEGALFVNHSSHGLVYFLKGQEEGFNRVSQLQNIRSIVTKTYSKPEDFTPVWYSDWDTPPLTTQSQRVFVYDMDNPDHGSMLDPENAVKFIARWFTWANTGALLKSFSNVGEIVGANIISGYTQKVTLHVTD